MWFQYKPRCAWASVSELLVEAPFSLVEVEMISDRGLSGNCDGNLSDHRAGRAGRNTLVAQLQASKLTDDADPLADRLVLDLRDVRPGIITSPAATPR